MIIVTISNKLSGRSRFIQDRLSQLYALTKLSQICTINLNFSD